MKFGILGNPTKESTVPVLNGLLNFLMEKKIDFLFEQKLSPLIKNTILKRKTDSVRSLLNKSDIVISLGGDGTFLNTASLIGNKAIPILGVNLGSLGFMAEIGPEEINNFIFRYS